MKLSFARSITLLLSVVITASAGFAQSEAQRLNARLGDLYQKGELDAAVPLAEEIVSIERKALPVSITNLISSLENLAQIKLDRVKRSMGQLRAPDLKPEKAASTIKMLRLDAAETEAHLRESIQLSQTSANALRSISLRSNLAWLLYNHIPVESNQSLGFDKDSRDKLEMRQRALYSTRFNDARALYSEAGKIAAAHQAGGPIELAVILNLAEFEAAMGNFESAIPLFGRFVSDAEKLLGKNDKQLLGPYESFLKVLVAAGQQDQAFEILSKIVTVSGRSTPYPKALLNLTYRAESSFAPVNSARIEEESRAMKARAELSGRGTVARAGAAGGDIVGTSLALSTNAREFYETADSKGIRMSRVAVKIEVDEAGKVTAAEGLTSDRNLKQSSEDAVRKWSFRPFSVSGKAAKLKGYAEVTILSN